MEIKKEWTYKAAWGNVALVSWGKLTGPPVLLLHGYMDSAATFSLLLKTMPNDRYYVGVDLPGHGKSDPFPSTLPIEDQFVVEVINKVVEHLQWEQFEMIAHSMGGVVALFYNHVYPGRLRMLVLLDPRPPLAEYYYFGSLRQWFAYFYKDYYKNYERYTCKDGRLYTREQAIALVKQKRQLTEEQAELILSRSLASKGVDTFEFSWDQRMKKIVTPIISEEILYAVLLAQKIPILCLDASETMKNIPELVFSENILSKIDGNLPNFRRATVEGGHDFHITSPELLQSHISEFLSKSDCFNKSKL